MIELLDLGWTETIVNIISFISLYYVVFWLLVLLDHEKQLKLTLKRFPETTIIIPAYNEENTIIPTLKSVEALDYPKSKISLIVVDDGSKDKTYSLAVAHCKKLKGFRSVLVLTQKNSGKYVAMNNALKHVDTEFFSTLDADSFPHKNSLKNILVRFTGKKIAAVSPIVKIHRPKRFVEVVQWFEYSVNHFYKSSIYHLNAIHVTPGPLSTYRTAVVKKLGGFREGHKTEDMEMAMRIQKHNYSIVQANDAFVYTKAPFTIRSLYKQRIRWNYGTLHNLKDYRKMLFNREYGDFGMFQLPVILLSGVLGVTILGLLVYDFIKGFNPALRSLQIYDYNIIEFLRNMEFNILWLDVDARVFVTFLTFFLLSLFVILLALRLHHEKYRLKSSFSFLLFIMYYFIFLAVVWVGVYINCILGRKSKWKS
jgi:cellulose synthase/poly-beta-1,6-N-acetylglucosamine synthase-like glycosyltransferase